MDIILTLEELKRVTQEFSPNIPHSKKGMLIKGGISQTKRLSVLYLALWIMCCNNNTSHATTVFSLQVMFGDKGRLTRQVVLGTIMNTKMTKGTPIRDQMVCMIKFLNKIETLQVENDGKTKVNMILET